MKSALIGITGATAILLLAPGVFSQTPVSKPSGVRAAATWTPPRTVNGQPDLQGVWTNATITPLERPADLANKPFFSNRKEADDYAQRTLVQVQSDRRDGGAEADVSRAYNEFWRDRGKTEVPSLRTSLIVDPPDGKIPLTAAAQRRAAGAQAETLRHPADGPEDRNLWERCITRGVPLVPGPYNNDFQILQNSGYVAIFSEMIHEVRMIPVDGRPHGPAPIRFWLGDPRGHWEGATLVVDSTNFSPQSNFHGASQGLHLTERFTRTGPDTILYQFTAEDPSTFTRPWKAEIPMRAMDSPIIEYACNEGNYAMSGILGGARAAEREAAAAKVKK